MTPLRGEEIDGRNLDQILILDRCICGQEYRMEIGLRKQCPDCEMKWLYPPDGVKSKPKYDKAELITNSILSVFAFVMTMLFAVRAKSLKEFASFLVIGIVMIWLPWALSKERLQNKRGA